MIDNSNKHRYSPLCLAAWKGHRDIVEFLAFKGSDVKIVAYHGWTPLTVSVFDEKIDVIESLYALGTPLETQDFDWQTPLMRAVWNYSTLSVRKLLELNADSSVIETRHLWQSSHKDIRNALLEHSSKSVMRCLEFLKCET